MGRAVQLCSPRLQSFLSPRQLGKDVHPDDAAFSVLIITSGPLKMVLGDNTKKKIKKTNPWRDKVQGARGRELEIKAI